jgi:hypothetical protein
MEIEPFKHGLDTLLIKDELGGSCHAKCQRSLPISILKTGICTSLEKVQLVGMVIADSFPEAGTLVFTASIDVHTSSEQRSKEHSRGYLKCRGGRVGYAVLKQIIIIEREASIQERISNGNIFSSD